MMEFIITTFFIIIWETLTYIFFTGFVFVAVFACGSACLLIIFVKRGVRAYVNKMIRFLIFLLILFCYGAIGNLLWVFLFNDRFYIVKDPLTYFVPLVPFGWWSICQPCGSKLLGGVEMWHLQLIWLFGAMIAWCATILTHRALKRKGWLPKELPPKNCPNVREGSWRENTYFLILAQVVYLQSLVA